MAEMEFSGLRPLEIYALSNEEKAILVQVLVLAKRHRLIRQNELERVVGDRSLRYVVGKASQTRAQIEARFRAGATPKSTRVEIAYEKWVLLYRHVMGPLLALAAAKNASEVLALIEELQQAGIESGRYDNDMHLFNARYLNQDTRRVSIDYRSIGLYIGFRLRSNRTDLLPSALQIFKTTTGERYAFQARLEDQHDDRDVKGTVFQLGSHLFLLGFLNAGEGGEYYALAADGRSHDVLYGVMATINQQGVPHAKQCCFIRAARIDGLTGLRDELATRSAWLDLRHQLSFLFHGTNLDVPVRLVNPPGVVNLRRYISEEMVFTRNQPRPEEFRGPPS